MRGEKDIPAAESLSKAAVRRQLLLRRERLSRQERAAASAAVVERLSDLTRAAGFRTVVSYAAMGSEVQLDPWLDELLGAGTGVFLPYVDGPPGAPRSHSTTELYIARIRSRDDLVPGWRGVREPRPELRRPARADRVDAFVVPGVGFDRAGGRLGYGGGHFDRLLARAGKGATIIGVAFSVQIVDRLPSEDHDVPMDLVVTDTEVITPDRLRTNR